ncbi:hypothetical protein AB1L88_25145 [Tautonia sp. JC769]|uniref:hypothetical protein n=1 Tax=Tautonia sp. JC769 TaxID=3232135 RepID=UPI003459A154
MNETIDRALERLFDINFFANVGSAKTLVVDGCDIVVLNSWDEAVTLRGSEQASDAFSEARSRLTRRLSAEFRKEFREWNAISRRNRERFETDLFTKVDKVIDAIPELQSIEHGRELVKDFVRWDMIHYAAEQAYSELVEPSFYSCVIEVYEAGCFPCNWNEVWPNGRIWVF